MVTALSIAGSDSIGGAGIQADIKAMASLGVHATTVITAVTAQNTCGVDGIYAIPPESIAAQLRAVLKDADVKAAKTGMLYCAETVRTVVEIWPSKIPLVVDPVLVAGVGDPLFHQGLVSAIRELLIPMATVVTPNRMEAETLTGITINDQEDAQQACRILGQGGTAVFLKGGHMEGDRVLDLFFHEGEFLRLDYPRLERAGHGGGCTLASYIASHMALGYSLRESVTLSRRLIQRSIASMFSVGRGERLVDPTVRLQQHQEETGARLSLRRAWPLCTEDRMFLEDATQLHLLQTYGLFPILDDLVVLSGPLQEDCWQAEETDIAPAPLLDILRRCRDKDPTIKGAAMLRLPATGFQGWNGARAIGVDRLQRHLEDGASVPDLIYENQNDTTEVLLVAVGKDAPDALRRLRGTR